MKVAADLKLGLGLLKKWLILWMWLRELVPNSAKIFSTFDRSKTNKMRLYQARGVPSHKHSLV